MAEEVLVCGWVPVAIPTEPAVTEITRNRQQRSPKADIRSAPPTGPATLTDPTTAPNPMSGTLLLVIRPVGRDNCRFDQ